MATTITIKNIPENVYNLLKKRAADHHRSLNNEIITIFEKEIISQKINPEEYLKSAKEIRKKLQEKGVYLTEKKLNKAKNYGRL
ncbi:MAG: Arc family DNA-binding protein [Candidatus Cloacimonetes bacterium]|nr:Arc family DNA-binding protein [Candidatus Cloacimonadota bacterium]